jgi:predicted DNA-binding protein
MANAYTYSLRLPKSLSEQVALLAKRDGTSINQFITIALAQKVAAMESAEQFFARKSQGADREKALKFLNRPNGAPPREGDELPEGWKD